MNKYIWPGFKTKKAKHQQSRTLPENHIDQGNMPQIKI